MKKYSIKHVFVAVVSICFSVAIYIYANSNLISKVVADSYYVVLPSSLGLEEGTPVRLGGYKVGQVESIQLTKDYESRVKFSIEKGIQIPIDTYVSLTSKSLISDSVEIHLVMGIYPAYLEEGEEIYNSTLNITLDEILDFLIDNSTLNNNTNQSD